MSHREGESIRSLSPEAVHEVVNRLEQECGAGAERIVDCRAAIDRLDNDVELFQDLLAFFFADSPELMAAVRASISEGNAEALHRAAHRLKGLMSNFDARRAVEAASRLETMGRQRALADAAAACEQLDRELERVTALLREFCPPGA
jgi:HPt (histidine-containing phosphotransfer) domain-containing protein